VGYHILPKFSGRHIYSPSLMKIQFWFANAGLIGMAISWSFIMRDSLLIFSRRLKQLKYEKSSVEWISTAYTCFRPQLSYFLTERITRVPVKTSSPCVLNSHYHQDGE
jgi:hypothetical protein